MSSRLEKKKPAGNKPESKKKESGASRLEPSKKKEPGMLQLTVTLCGICAACALLLGIANMVTEPIIEANQEAKKAQAIAAEVLPGFTGTLTQVNYTGSDGTIKSLQKGSDGSFVVEVSPKNSFSGTLTLLVGVDASETVTGVSVTQSGETKDLGSRASEPEFRNQFVGKSGSVSLTKDGGEIQAISGASITSGAVCDAVNSALEAIHFASDAPFDPSLVTTPEPVEDAAMPGFDGELTDMSYSGGDNTILSVKQAGDMGYVVEVDCGSGSFSGTLTIQVGVSNDKTVTGVMILESGETEGFGAKAADLEWRQQFQGQSGTVALTTAGGEIDSIAGASTTSGAICVGVSAALSAVDTLG